MEDYGDDIQMNIDLSVGASFRKEKKQKLTKLERVRIVLHSFTTNNP